MPKRPPSFTPLHHQTRQERDRAYDAKRRDVPWRAWYSTARWLRLREAQLSAEPLCEMCKRDEIITSAEVCDHVTPHRGNEELFWSGPFQSLCAHHHNSVKQREERGEGEGRVDSFPPFAAGPVGQGLFRVHKI